MKFSLAFIAALLAPAVSAGVFSTTVTDEDHKIPGESPLELCDGDRSSDLIQIKSVDLSPNPPKA